MLFEKKKKLTLKIEGLHCMKCVAKVEAALKAIGAKADIDLKLGRAAITCPAKLENEALIKAVADCGFTATVL